MYQGKHLVVLILLRWYVPLQRYIITLYVGELYAVLFHRSSDLGARAVAAEISCFPESTPTVTRLLR